MPGPQLLYGAKPVLLRRSLRAAPLAPKPIGQRGDMPLFNIVTAMPGRVSAMLASGLQVSVIGVLQRLPGAFMSGQTIFLSVVLYAAAMGMGGAALLLGGDLL
jgi:hypothetical protein